MIDIDSETLITIGQARAHPVFHTRGARPTLAKMYRLIGHGARAANGERVRLEAIRAPSGMMTSREAIARFVARLTDPEADIPTPTPAARRAQIDRAVAELEAAGFEVGAPAT